MVSGDARLIRNATKLFVSTNTPPLTGTLEFKLVQTLEIPLARYSIMGAFPLNTCKLKLYHKFENFKPPEQIASVFLRFKAIFHPPMFLPDVSSSPVILQSNYTHLCKGWIEGILTA
jgi:hypothetical protein